MADDEGLRCVHELLLKKFLVLFISILIICTSDKLVSLLEPPRFVVTLSTWLTNRFWPSLFFRFLILVLFFSDNVLHVFLVLSIQIVNILLYKLVKLMQNALASAV